MSGFGGFRRQAPATVPAAADKGTRQVFGIVTAAVSLCRQATFSPLSFQCRAALPVGVSRLPAARYSVG